MPIRLTRTVKYLIIACVIVFFVQQGVDRFLGGNLLGWFGLVPADVVVHLRIWQLVTYAFLHADPMHLFINLLMLAFIGAELEMVWGMARFLRFYFFCSIAAGIFYLILQLFIHGEGLHVPMIGASGAIYGLLAAYGILFGERVLLFMLLFPMKAKHFIWILAALEFMTTVFSGPNSGVAGIAHLGGMAAGFMYLWGRARYQILQRERHGGPKKRKPRRGGSGHLKLIINNEREGGEGDFDTEDSDDEGPKTWH